MFKKGIGEINKFLIGLNLMLKVEDPNHIIWRLFCNKIVKASILIQTLSIEIKLHVGLGVVAQLRK